MSKTVFVTGAGASLDFDRSNTMPVGSALAEQIEQLLESEIRKYRTQSAGRVASSIMRSAAGFTANHLSAMRRIREGIQSRNSIDDFVDEWSDVPHLVEIAKLCIADRILNAERASILGPLGKRDADVAGPLRILRSSWLGTVARLLNRSARRRDVAEVYKDTAFITFNYDRCIEQFLYHNFTNTNAVARSEVDAILARIPIIHVYGSLGPLPGDSSGVAFGSDDSWDLTKAANGIRTYAEEMADESIDQIRTVLQSAEKVIFLGCAYHPQNLKVLFGSKPPSHTYYWGTTLGMRGRVLNEAVGFFGAGGGLRRFESMDCAALLAAAEDEIFS